MQHFTNTKLVSFRKHVVIFPQYFTVSERGVVAGIACLLDLQLPMQSVSITTDVVGSTPTQGEVSLQQVEDYVIQYQVQKGFFLHQIA
jgi:hypothetical protein